ncbi:hypothetical protein SUGI_0737940 [Cryptomeria japonica]|uniref:ABC transporter B family member 15 n=1 Tax=Cryptomeria japonica TaxID=3369 RepID=UPI002414B76C|nr:ABC transporter B family member 15 [Cryptomeria japonica]GLJ36676.1 hypothetical protein SUGI_0737940 [Cryptomeria japonica]
MDTNSENPKGGSGGSSLKASSSGSVSVWKLLTYADSVDVMLMVFGTLGSIADGASTPITILVLSNFMNVLDNAGSDGKFLHNVNKNSICLLYVAAALWIAAFLEAFCWTRTGERQASRLRMKFLKAVLRQDVGFFDTQATTTSQIVTSISNDTLVIQDVFSEKVPNFTVNVSTFLTSYVAAFFLIWKLALVGFPFIVLLIIPGMMYGRTLTELTRKMHAKYKVAGNVAEQAVSSIRTVYSLGGEDKSMAKFSAALEGTVKLGLKQGLAKGMAIGSNGLSFAIWAFLAWYGSLLVMYHGVSGGAVFATGACTILGGLALGTALPNIRYFSEACLAGYRILEIMERIPAIDSEDCKGQTVDVVAGEVEFKNVEFAYPSRAETKIFHDLNLTVPANQTVALVGGSGSGKSTAIALLQRFYDPAVGHILLDGVDIRTLNLKWLRAQMGLVSQEPALFATSIKENILFGNEEASMDQVIAAAKAAHAHDFITQLPEAYDTHVGERGVQMSGGQKQRIAIARAVLKDPRILLLDEATSALDAQSEKMVQDALEQAAYGRTTVIIAHRLSTIRNADLIAVLQSGCVVESGTHQDLIERPGGAYAALVHLQLQTRTVTDPSKAVDDDTRASTTSKSAGMRASRTSFSAAQTANPAAVPPSFRRLLLLNAPEWKRALLGTVCAVGFGAVQPVYCFVLANMVSVFFLRDHDDIKSKTRLYTLVFVALAAFSFLVNVVQHYNFAAMGECLTKRVRERMLHKILSFEIGWFDEQENSSGAICSHLATEANVVKSLVGDRLSLVFQTLSAVTIAFTMGLIIAWRLAILMIAVQPLIIACFYTRKVLLKAMSAKALKAQEEGSQLAAEAVANHRTITAFSSQQRILRMFERTQQGPRQESPRQSWFAGLALGTSQSLALCTWALDFWYGGKLVDHGYITSDALIKTFLILVSTGRVIAEAGSMTSDIAKGSNAVKSVFAILDRKSRIIPDDPRVISPDRIEGNVEARDVCFAYPSRPNTMVLRNFSLKIAAGNCVALVGQSGSGKSTIIGLLERFYDPITGTITIDGNDLRSYNLRTLRQHMALVGQEPTLLGGTIRDNILYGKENATDAEVIEAAKIANAHNFISSLKDGYDTMSGDKGAQLSGGQKQRIAIARAIIRKPSILLLDEATSALDSESEMMVQEALERVMGGRTSIVVAHQLTTIQNVDSIAVIADGIIVEQGSHEELTGRGESSSYFSLIKLQQKHQQR